jgi:hypothetical protein
MSEGGSKGGGAAAVTAVPTGTGSELTTPRVGDRHCSGCRVGLH